MSFPLATVQAARTVFQEGFDRNAQQQHERFRPYCIVKTGVTGKMQSFKKIQKREMQDVTGRLQPTVGQEQTWEHRYVEPLKASLTTILDEDDADELALAVAPTGEIITEHNSAAARKVDKYFINGILGNNLEGAEGNIQSVSLPSSQIIAVNYRRDGGSANTGLTLAKLVRAKGRFGKQEVYGQNVDNGAGKICMAVSQDELDNLLHDVTQTGSADYNKVKALVDGEVDYFMGIKFLRTEQLPYTTPGGGKIIRSCPMWITTGVKLYFWKEVKTNLDVLPELSQALQIFSRLRANACRVDEDRVVNVLCEQDA